MVLAALVVGLLVLLLVRRLNAPHEKEPPRVESGLPLVGPLIEFSSTPRPFLQRLEKQYGQAFTLDLLIDKMTFILGREGNRLFFDSTDDILDFNSAVAAVAQNVLGPETFTEDPVWTSKSSPYITKGFMRHERLSLYNSLINDEVRKHIKIWCGKDKVDLFKSVSQLVTSINIRCVLGDDAYHAHAEEIASIYYQLELSAMDTVAILFPSLPTATKRANEKARKRLIEIISNVLHSRSEDQETSDYIGMVWTAEKENHSVHTFAMHALAVMFAAHTNTAGTTGWTLANWANNQSLADKALREQTQLIAEMGEEAETLAPNFISKLEYLDSCMKETVRRYGMLMLVRKAMKDVAFTSADGREFIIPKGRTVVSSPFLSHHNSEVYPEPSLYDPERFADPERKQSLVANRHYVQFGFGRHKCLGERFANVVIKMVLSLVLRSCQFELVSDMSDADYRKQAGTPNPEHTIWVKFRPRE